MAWEFRPDDEWISVREMRHRYGVSKSTAYEWIHWGGFPAFKPGGKLHSRVVINVRCLNIWIAARQLSCPEAVGRVDVRGRQAPPTRAQRLAGQERRPS